MGCTSMHLSPFGPNFSLSKKLQAIHRGQRRAFALAANDLFLSVSIFREDVFFVRAVERGFVLVSVFTPGKRDVLGNVEGN